MNTNGHGGVREGAGRPTQVEAMYREGLDDLSAIVSQADADLARAVVSLRMVRATAVAIRANPRDRRSWGQARARVLAGQRETAAFGEKTAA